MRFKKANGNNPGVMQILTTALYAYLITVSTKYFGGIYERVACADWHCDIKL